MKKRRCSLKSVLTIAVLAVFLIFLPITEILIDANAKKLTVRTYEFPTAVSSPIRIVQLSDLHDREFGADNSDLTALVRDQNPDLIALTGDMLDKSASQEDVEALYRLVSDLKQIAPVYWADGNHERMFVRATGTPLHQGLSEAGCIVLDCSYADVSVCGQALRIGGYSGYYGTPHMTTDDTVQEEAENAFFRDFENTRQLKLLLCHIPTSWLDWNYIDKYPVDLVLCGHYHGGQIRLPIIGGLYAPYVGLFPEYTEGMYEGKMATAILSTGLGASPGIPRFNNPAQVVVVDLIPENS